MFARERLEELQSRDKLDFYLAALTAEVRRSWVSKPENVKDDVFLRKFFIKDRNNPTSKAPVNSIAKEKTAWALVMAAGRLNKRRKKPTPKRPRK